MVVVFLIQYKADYIAGNVRQRLLQGDCAESLGQSGGLGRQLLPQDLLHLLTTDIWGVRRQNQGPDNSVELSKIAAPAEVLKQHHSLGFKADDLAAQLGIELVYIEGNHAWNVFPAVPQRGKPQGDGGKVVFDVGAYVSLFTGVVLQRIGKEQPVALGQPGLVDKIKQLLGLRVAQAVR